MINEHNEFELKPGVYELLSATVVVTDIITHTIDPKTGGLSTLPEPLVVYRDLSVPVRDIGGKPTQVHERTTVPISYFKSNSKQV